MPQDKEQVVVFGASGHAKVVVDIIENQGIFDVTCLADDDPSLKGQQLFGYEIAGGRDELLAMENRPSRAVVAIGKNEIRGAVAAWLVENGFNLVTVVHPSVVIGRGVQLGVGTVLMANVTVNPDTAIGENVIVNTKAGIDHDCVIGDAVHIAPGATLCGGVSIGEGSFICAGSTVLPGVSIGSEVVVGAGAVVMNDVPDGVTVVGVPAQPIDKNRRTE